MVEIPRIPSAVVSDHSPHFKVATSNSEDRIELQDVKGWCRIVVEMFVLLFTQSICPVYPL